MDFKEFEDQVAAIAELKAMNHDQLMKVPHDLVKWHCQGQNCDRGTMVYDFGIRPYVYWQKRWVNTASTFFLCGKHNKMWKKLNKMFVKETVHKKILSQHMPVVDPARPFNQWHNVGIVRIPNEQDVADGQSVLDLMNDPDE